MKFHTIVMAAQRVGEENPVAKAAGVSHKCLAQVDDKPLLKHVLDTLVQCEGVGLITVMIERPEIPSAIPGFDDLVASGRVRTRPSADNLTDSLKSGLQGLDEPYPTFITTGDNALLLPENVDWFLEEAARAGTDAVLAMCRKDVIQGKYPDGECNFHKFADGEWSNANLYALMTEGSFGAAEMFRGGGQFSKKPHRAGRAMGAIAGWFYRKAILPRSWLLSIARIKFGVSVAAVDSPWPESPIDVDDAHTLELATTILAARRNAS